MELHDENAFKVKAITNAAFKIDKLPYPIAERSLENISQIEGIGKNTASRVWALITSGGIPEMDELLGRTPPGVAEMMQLKGLGPKKIKIIWQELGIESIGELYYACNENRLVEAKGFGLKTQQEIAGIIEFKMASSGKFIYAKIEGYAEQLLQDLKIGFNTQECFHAGQFRRKCEVIDELEFVIAGTELDKAPEVISNFGLNVVELHSDRVICSSEFGVDIILNFCETGNMGWRLLELTGNSQHLNSIRKAIQDKTIVNLSEEEIYNLAGYRFIEPELREGLSEFEPAQYSQNIELIKYSDIKGALHNHSTWSDGVNTILEMALHCRDEMGLEYLGMSDHSKSAFYANGLNEERIEAQHREIDLLNEQLRPFRIFKGIESDILYDGSLDYSNEVLATFDFVVASIHTSFKMSEEKATQRLITAIENPYTTILGHPTGRLLLSRSGYQIDHRKVIDACAANGVIIEINSNPLRLDIDWRWHQYAIKKNVLLSINPDAHRVGGLSDMYYGTLVARKGGLTAKNCLNTFSLTEIEEIFSRKKPDSVG